MAGPRGAMPLGSFTPTKISAARICAALGWLCLALWPQPMGAQGYASLAEAARHGPSPRLYLYAQAITGPQGDVAEIDRAKTQHGLYHSGPAPKLLARALHFAPQLYFDPNINGGTPGHTVMIAGLPFTLDAAARAVSGGMLGGQLGSAARFSLAHGRVLEGQVQLSYARHMASDLAVSAARAQLCGAQYLGHAAWLDLCAARSQTRRALGKNGATTLSAALAQQYRTARGAAEFSVKVERQHYENYDKLHLNLSLTTARARLGTLALQAEFGAPVAGHHSRLFGASAALTRPIAGQSRSIFASFAREGGADFFGTARADQLLSLGITSPIGPRASVTVSITDRHSTLPSYSQQTFGLAFSFRPKVF